MSKSESVLFCCRGRILVLLLLKAQTCGTPVIAFGKGLLETIRPYGVQNQQELSFDNQKVADIINAIQEFEKISHKILPIDCRSNAIRFSNERFQAEINDYINKNGMVLMKQKRLNINF